MQLDEMKNKYGIKDDYQRFYELSCDIIQDGKVVDDTPWNAEYTLRFNKDKFKRVMNLASELNIRSMQLQTLIKYCYKNGKFDEATYNTILNLYRAGMTDGFDLQIIGDCIYKRDGGDTSIVNHKLMEKLAQWFTSYVEIKSAQEPNKDINIIKNNARIFVQRMIGKINNTECEATEYIQKFIDAGLIDNRKNRKKMANFYEKMGFDVPDDNTVIRKLLPWLGAGLGAVGGGIAAYYDADKHPEHYAASGTVEGETEPTQTTYSGSSTYTGSTHYTGTVPHDEIQDGVTVAHYDIAYEGDVNYNGSVNYNGTIEVGPIPFSKDYQGELTDLGKAAVTTAGTGLGGAAGAGLGELAKLFFPVAEADQFKGKSAQDIIETGMTQNIKDPQAQALTGEILRVAKERGLDDEELIGAFKAGYGQQTGKVITVRELAGILDAVKVMEHAEKPSQGAIDNANKRADEAEQEAQDLKADIEEKDAEIENLQKQLKDCQDGEDCVGVVEEEPDAVPRTTLKISELPFRTGRWYLANGFVSADDKPLSQRDISNIMKYLRDNVAYEDNSRGRHTGIVLPNEITIGDKTFKLADDAVARINKLSARGGGNDPKYGKVSKNGSKWIFTDCDGSMQTFNTESEARAAQRKAHPNMK